MSEAAWVLGRLKVIATVLRILYRLKLVLRSVTRCATRTVLRLRVQTIGGYKIAYRFAFNGAFVRWANSRHS